MDVKKALLVLILSTSSISYSACEYLGDGPRIVEYSGCQEETRICIGDVECDGERKLVQCVANSDESCPGPTVCSYNFALTDKMCMISPASTGISADKYDELVKELETYHNDYTKDGNQRLFELYVIESGERRLKKAFDYVANAFRDTNQLLNKSLKSLDFNKRYEGAVQTAAAARATLDRIHDFKSSIDAEKEYVLSHIKLNSGLATKYREFSNNISAQIDLLELAAIDNDKLLTNQVELLSDKRLRAMTEEDKARIDAGISKLSFENSLHDISSMMDSLSIKAHRVRSEMRKVKKQEERYFELTEDLAGIIAAARDIRDNGKKIISSALTPERKKFYDEMLKEIDYKIKEIEGMPLEGGEKTRGVESSSCPFSTLSGADPDTYIAESIEVIGNRTFKTKEVCVDTNVINVTENSTVTTRRYVCTKVDSVKVAIEVPRVMRIISESGVDYYYDHYTKIEEHALGSSIYFGSEVISNKPNVTPRSERDFDKMYGAIRSANEHFNDTRTNQLLDIAGVMKLDRDSLDAKYESEIKLYSQRQQDNQSYINDGIKFTKDFASSVKDNAPALVDMSVSMVPVYGDSYDVCNAVYASITDRTVMGDPAVSLEDKMVLWLAAGPIINLLEARLAKGAYDLLKQPKVRRLFAKLAIQSVGDLIKYLKRFGVEKTVKFLEYAEMLGVKTKKDLRVFSEMYDSVSTIPNGIQVSRIKMGNDPNKIAVIGRKMNAVVDKTVEHLGAKADKFEWSTVARENFYSDVADYQRAVGDSNARLPFEEVKKTSAYKENADWIKEKIDEGYTILDMGDPLAHNESEGLSAFYELEKSIVFGKK